MSRGFATASGAASKKEENKSDDKNSKAEKQFDYSKMDYYEILETIPTASEKQLKIAYLKCARKYHPDVYKGVN